MMRYILYLFKNLFLRSHLWNICAVLCKVVWSSFSDRGRQTRRHCYAKFYSRRDSLSFLNNLYHRFRRRLLTEDYAQGRGTGDIGRVHNYVCTRDFSKCNNSQWVMSLLIPICIYQIYSRALVINFLQPYLVSRCSVAHFGLHYIYLIIKYNCNLL